MTTITLPRAVVEQALGALESVYGDSCDALHALRAALAQQAEPVQEPVEPVAWSGYDLDGMVEAFSRVIEARYQRANPFQNPIDMDAQMALRILRGFIPAMKAYAVPPQRKPLTEGEIDGLVIQHAGYGRDNFYAVARAVERTHEIKE